MTQKTEGGRTVFYCVHCGRDDFNSRQAAAAHEKVCPKNPANDSAPAPAKIEQPPATPAKDEQEETAKIPFAPPSPPEKPSPSASPPSSGDSASLTGDEPAFPVGIIILIVFLAGVGIAVVMMKDSILKFWQEIVGGDNDGKQPPAAPTV